jgi:hypothetical protein
MSPEHQRGAYTLDSRAALVEKDLGQHVILRDGYLFAAPIVCDVASVKGENMNTT